MAMEITSGSTGGLDTVSKGNAQAMATGTRKAGSVENQQGQVQEVAQTKSQEEGHQPSDGTILEVLAKTNSKLGSTKCEFAYHEGTHMVSITIRDKDTNEVVKEIPPEKSLEMLQKMWEVAGILVDEKR